MLLNFKWHIISFFVNNNLVLLIILILFLFQFRVLCGDILLDLYNPVILKNGLCTSYFLLFNILHSFILLSPAIPDGLYVVFVIGYGNLVMEGTSIVYSFYLVLVAVPIVTVDWRMLSLGLSP